MVYFLYVRTHYAKLLSNGLQGLLFIRKSSNSKVVILKIHKTYYSERKCPILEKKNYISFLSRLIAFFFISKENEGSHLITLFTAHLFWFFFFELLFLLLFFTAMQRGERVSTRYLICRISQIMNNCVVCRIQINQSTARCVYDGNTNRVLLVTC